MRDRHITTTTSKQDCERYSADWASTADALSAIGDTHAAQIATGWANYWAILSRTAADAPHMLFVMAEDI